MSPRAEAHSAQASDDPAPRSVRGPGAALAELIEARHRLEAAEDELEVARDGAHLALRRLGAFLLHEGVAVPHELHRRLYWEYPDPHVEVTAKAFGLRQRGEPLCWPWSPAGAVSAARHAGDPYRLFATKRGERPRSLAVR